jgi:uncharacterized membrane protein
MKHTQLVFINQPPADLVMIVAALVSNLLVQTSQPQTRFLTVAAAGFLPGQLAGKEAAFLLCLSVVLWRRNLLASRQRGKRPQAQIKPNPFLNKALTSRITASG